MLPQNRIGIGTSMYLPDLPDLPYLNGHHDMYMCLQYLRYVPTTCM